MSQSEKLQAGVELITEAGDTDDSISYMILTMSMENHMGNVLTQMDQNEAIILVDTLRHYNPEGYEMLKFAILATLTDGYQLN